MDFHLPVLRADLALWETCWLADPTPIDVPVHAVAGKRDALASPSMMAAWQALARKSFDLREVDAGHVFLSRMPVRLARLPDRVLLQGQVAAYALHARFWRSRDLPSRTCAMCPGSPVAPPGLPEAATLEQDGAASAEHEQVFP